MYILTTNDKSLGLTWLLLDQLHSMTMSRPITYLVISLYSIVLFSFQFLPLNPFKQRIVCRGDGP